GRLRPPVGRLGTGQGGKPPRGNDEPASSGYSTALADTFASARAPASTSMSTTSTRTMTVFRAIVAHLPFGCERPEAQRCPTTYHPRMNRQCKRASRALRYLLLMAPTVIAAPPLAL